MSLCVFSGGPRQDFMPILLPSAPLPAFFLFPEPFPFPPRPFLFLDERDADAEAEFDPGCLFDPDCVDFLGVVAGEVSVAGFFVRCDLRGVETGFVFEVSLRVRSSRAVSAPEALLFGLGFATRADFLKGTDGEVAAFLVPVTLDLLRVVVPADSLAV